MNAPRLPGHPRNLENAGLDLLGRARKIVVNFERADPRLRLSRTVGLQAGVAADMVGVWHNGHSFVLDFCAQSHPGQHDEAGGAALKFRVVARVRIPPTLIFDVIKAIGDNLDGYEQ